MPSKTIKIMIDTGACEIGPVPAGTQVVLEAGYLYSKEGRAPLNEALQITDADARNRAALARVAQFVVTGWNISPVVDRAAVEAFLVALYEEEPGVARLILERLADRQRFGRPALVDPEALGEG